MIFRRLFGVGRQTRAELSDRLARLARLEASTEALAGRARVLHEREMERERRYAVAAATARARAARPRKGQAT